MNLLSEPGATFAGFRIVRQLGAGGMGEVYLVEHPRLPRREALKVLTASFTTDDEYRQRFQREAELAAQLWHPNLVSLHDRGEAEGRLWISMDYVDGFDIAELVRTKYRAGMPAADVAEIVTAVGSALDYAHQSGMLHRDVKPANIVCSRPGATAQRIALADFGIAREINDALGITATNRVIGTVAYAAPEQLMGTAIDGRADQYALAATAFHLLTGSPPFQDANPAAVISQHLTAPAPRLSDYRPELVTLDEVLIKALSKDPAQRYPDCTAFAHDLHRQAAGASTAPGGATHQSAFPGSSVTVAALPPQASSPADPPSTPPAPPRSQGGSRRPRLRHRTAWAGGSAAAVVLIAGGIWAVPHLAGGREEIGDSSRPSNRTQDSRPLTEAATPNAESKPIEPLPFNASGLLAGTADPHLPDGETDKVSVIQIGPLAEASAGSAKLPFAFRNNTSEGISHVDWAATARSGGSIVATGSSQGTAPAQVRPGEVGLAFIYFEGNSKLPPPDAGYEFTVHTSAADQSSYNTAPLKVTEANLSDAAVVGAAVNGTGKSVDGPFSVSTYCFEGDKLLNVNGAYAEQDGPIAPDGNVTFSANLYGAACPTFTVGVTGWFE